MKSLLVSLHTISFNFRCGGKVDLTSEVSSYCAQFFYYKSLSAKLQCNRECRTLWVVGFKVFLCEGLSLRAALGVFLTNTWYSTSNDGRSWLTPGRNRKTGGDVLLSSFKYSALVNETLPLQSPICWLGQSLPHRVVLQPLEFGSLAKQFEISAIIKWQEPCNCFQLHYWCWLHGPCDDVGCLVLYFADPIKVGLSCSAPCCHAILKYWSDSTSVQSLESHSICSPCHACQLLHESKSHLGSGFSFFGLLFPGQPLVKNYLQVGGVVLSKQSLAVDVQGGLPGIDSY